MDISLIYQLTLVSGYKVGRVDQAETALGAEMRVAASKDTKKKVTAEDKGKDKIVRRALNKVYTNGTLVDAELLMDNQAGHCVSIREAEGEDGRDQGVCASSVRCTRRCLEGTTIAYSIVAGVTVMCPTPGAAIVKDVWPSRSRGSGFSRCVLGDGELAFGGVCLGSRVDDVLRDVADQSELVRACLGWWCVLDSRLEGRLGVPSGLGTEIVISGGKNSYWNAPGGRAPGRPSSHALCASVAGGM